MISIDSLEKAYPENLRTFKRGILREYIQYKLLSIIYDSKYSGSLIFLGGTALRIVHDNQRFSEDLDFDNWGMNAKDFTDLSDLIKKEMSLIGLECETRVVEKNAIHIYVKFPDILYTQGMTPLKNEKITIQIDATAQDFQFEPELYLLDKFDVYTNIKVTPLDIILSEKIYAVFNRKRLKGRDLYDIDYIINNLKVKPNLKYLDMKLGIKTYESLKKELDKKISKVNLNKLGEDVKVFLFDQNTVSRVVGFKEGMNSWKL